MLNIIKGINSFIISSCNQKRHFSKRSYYKIEMASTMPTSDIQYKNALEHFEIDDVEIIHMDKEHRDSHKFYGSRITNSPTLVLNADYKPLNHLPLSLWYV